MTACTPDGREMPLGHNDAVTAPDDAFDLKAFELLDDIYNAVSPSTRKAIMRNVQNKMLMPHQIAKRVFPAGE